MNSSNTAAPAATSPSANSASDSPAVKISAAASTIGCAAGPAWAPNATAPANELSTACRPASGTPGRISTMSRA